MSISKKKLKDRLIDICNGAGLEWIEDGEYFEAHNDQLESVGMVMQAIEREFLGGKSTSLRTPWRLKDFNDIDTLTDLVLEAIEYDVKS